ncbi:MAG TPA: hypothetical protein VMM93_01375 [Vicinamibacterales bacterium]|nr:hypothetical protein [Vicinamibacterales bacterium]
MNGHPTDETLILHFYRELPAAEAHAVATHLESCGACRAAWEELVATLTLVDAAHVPEPGPGFERVVWARVSESLPAPAWSWRSVVPIGALAAAALVVAVVTGSMRGAGPGPQPVSSDVTGVDANIRTQKRVLFTALDDHFHQTEVLLVELMNASAGDIDLGFEREAADELVASSRLYRATARDTGDDQFAQVLEDLEHMLIEVARSPLSIVPADFESLRQRIGDEDWLFKVRAAATEVRTRQQSLNVISEGPL